MRQETGIGKIRMHGFVTPAAALAGIAAAAAAAKSAYETEVGMTESGGSKGVGVDPGLAAVTAPEIVAPAAGAGAAAGAEATDGTEAVLRR